MQERDEFLPFLGKNEMKHKKEKKNKQEKCDWKSHFKKCEENVDWDSIELVRGRKIEDE